MVKSVAVIGVGTMGTPMAMRVRDAGYDLMVCDTNENALAQFAALGVPVTTDPQSCLDADLVMVLVATPQQMWDVVAGENGLAAGNGDSETIVAVMSTVNPAPLRELRDAVADTGLVIVDAPISGGVVRAANGTLTVILGGDDASVEAVKPVFASFGREAFHVGDVGAAQTVKVVNNMLGVVNYLVVAEAYRIAVDHGLELADVTRVLEVSTGRNFLSSDPAEAPATFAAYAKSQQASETLLSILRKDISLANDLGADLDANWARLGNLTV